MAEGALITRVNHGVLSLVVAAVGIVGVVITVISTLSGGSRLEFLDIVSETHFDDWLIGSLSILALAYEDEKLDLRRCCDHANAGVLVHANDMMQTRIVEGFQGLAPLTCFRLCLCLCVVCSVESVMMMKEG